jgi:hypothetical protein
MQNATNVLGGSTGSSAGKGSSRFSNQLNIFFLYRMLGNARRVGREFRITGAILPIFPAM